MYEDARPWWWLMDKEHNIGTQNGKKSFRPAMFHSFMYFSNQYLFSCTKPVNGLFCVAT